MKVLINFTVKQKNNPLWKYKPGEEESRDPY